MKERGKCYMIRCTSVFEPCVRPPTRMCIIGDPDNPVDGKIGIFCESNEFRIDHIPGLCEYRINSDNLCEELSEIDSILFKLEYTI